MKKLKIALLILAVLTLLTLTACNTNTYTPDDGDGGNLWQSERTITFDSRGGTEVPPIVAMEQTCVDLNSIPTPERAGYEFKYWYYGEEDNQWGGQQWDGYVPGNDGFVLYAFWEPIYYGITIDMGRYSFICNGMYENYFTEYTLEDTPSFEMFTPNPEDPFYPLDEGYVFGGWYADAEFTRPVDGIDVEGGFFGDVTLYGKVEFFPLRFWEYDENSYYCYVLTPSMDFDISNPVIAEDVAAFTSLTVPSEYNGKPVVEVRNVGAFDLTEITLPDTLKYVDAADFSNLTALTQPVLLPDGLESFKTGYTYDNFVTAEYQGGMYVSTVSNPYAIFIRPLGEEQITEIELHPDTKMIGPGAFLYNDNYPHDPIGHLISEINIPESVIFIGYEAFAGCVNLTSITLGDNVKTIEDNAFRYCTGLTSVYIGANAKIGELSFYDANNITNLAAPTEVLKMLCFTELDKVETLTVTGGDTLSADILAPLTSLKTLNLSDNVKSVAADAFMNNVKLEKVNVSAGIESLESLEFLRDFIPTEKTLYGGAYYVGSEGNPYFILYSAQDSSLTEIDIHPDTKFIWHNAMEGNTALVQPTFPEGLIDIGDNAFADSALYAWGGTEDNGGIYVGNTTNPYLVLTSIANGASDFVINDNTVYFSASAYAAAALKTIILPAGITRIPAGMFKNNTWVESIILPEGVVEIGDEAFRGCTSLRELSIPGTVVKVGKNIVDFDVYDDPSTGKMTVKCSSALFRDGTGGYYLGNADNRYHLLYAIWDDSTSLQNSYTVADGCVIVGTNVLRSNMYEITLPDTVTVISDYAFGYNIAGVKNNYSDGIYKITLSKAIEYIGDFAFANCKKLNSAIKIPDSCTYLGKFAFQGCYAIPSVTIGSGIAVIRDSAFLSCNAIREIVIPDTVAVIEDHAFMSCTSLKTVRIGWGVKHMGIYAFSMNFNENGNYLYDGYAYCKVSEKPDGWADNWISENVTVVWSC